MKAPERIGFFISFALHLLALAWLVAATFWWAGSARETEPVVFEMVSGPKTPFEIPGPKAPGPITGEKPGAPGEEAVDLPDLTAPDIPDVPVEPVEAVPEPPAVAPEPKPAPKPEPKPAPKSSSKPQKPKVRQMSYEEFLKNTKDGRKVDRRQNTVRSRPSASRGNVPKIKIDKSGIKSLGRFVVSGGQGGGGGGAAGSRGVGISSGGGLSSAMARYMDALQQRIDANWDKPDTDSGAGISATVYFTVNKSGLIGSRRIVKSSGSQAFDRSVLSVFDKLGYVGVPPEGETGFNLTFNLDE